MKQITPCLWFDNNAEEAVKFYTSLFKNSKIITTAYYGEEGPGKKGDVMVIYFIINGQDFIALNGGPTFKLTEAVSFVINCDSQDEIDLYWDKLIADGGQPSMCGWLKDKFGLSWQIVPAQIGKYMSGNPAKTENVMKEVMKMTKLDVSKMEEAYNK
jgi:predicted 3-demethylubiquinone-9 3-methyltransferase (glyoxalase superfamily)